MTLDMYSEKVAEASALIHEFAKTDYYHFLQGDPEKSLEAFIAMLDQAEEKGRQSQAARIAELERGVRALPMTEEQLEELADEFSSGDRGDFDYAGFAQAVLAAAPSAPAVEQQPNKTLLTVANDVRWACMKLYSPDDTATDWTDKMAALDIRAIVEKVQAAAPKAADTDKVREALIEALHEGRRAVGDHYAPNDCYATGPLTGDPYRDLVQCPACSFISMYDEVIATAAQAPVREVPGYKLVPLEVTDAMLEAWKAELCVPIGSSPEAKARRAYRAMLAAAPVQQEGV